MEDWLLLQNGVWLYVTIFFALLGGAFGLPIPEDLPLIAGGVLIQKGRADIGILFLVCYSAVILGDLIIYRIGNRLGPALFTQRWFRRRVTLSKIKNLRANLDKRSFVMIFFARHLFYLRTITFLVCGAVKMSFLRFLIADMAAALISLPIMMGIGYIGAEHFDAIVDHLSSIRRSVVLATLPVLIAITLYYLRKRRLRLKAEQEAENEDDGNLSTP